MVRRYMDKDTEPPKHAPEQTSLKLKSEWTAILDMVEQRVNSMQLDLSTVSVTGKHPDSGAMLTITISRRDK